MPTMDLIFHKEFKAMLRERYYLNVGFSLSSIPVSLQGEFYDISGFDAKKAIYKVSNISQAGFDKLNGSLVQFVPGEQFIVDLTDDSGNPVLDALGQSLFTVVDIPKECCAVSSTMDLGLRLNLDKAVTDAESYFGFVKKESMFWYFVPKVCLRKVNPVSLCLSFKKPKLCYSCAKVALTNGYEIFVSVVPIEEAAKGKYRILATKLSVDFRKEIQALYAQWLANEVVFDNRLCGFSTDYDSSCLSWLPMESTLTDYEYNSQVSYTGLEVNSDESVSAEDENVGAEATESASDDDWTW